MQIRKSPASKLKVLLWIILAIAIIGGGAYAYHVVTAQPDRSPQQNNLIEQTAEEPEVDKPKYTPVSEQNPSRIMIDKIGVDANIESVGLTHDGLMASPNTNHGVGWYDKSSGLGGDKYAMLLDGHYGTDDNHAVFYRLSELELGDTIDVQGADGATLSYNVVETEQQYEEDVDMEKAMHTYSEDTQSLTIITCEGLFDAENVTYDERTIVYAERVE